jgi:hypothetical protein
MDQVAVGAGKPCEPDAGLDELARQVVDAAVEVQAQVISYLKASGARLALLINFNERLLKEGIQRVVLS